MCAHGVQRGTSSRRGSVNVSELCLTKRQVPRGFSCEIPSGSRLSLRCLSAGGSQVKYWPWGRKMSPWLCDRGMSGGVLGLGEGLTRPCGSAGRGCAGGAPGRGSPGRPRVTADPAARGHPCRVPAGVGESPVPGDFRVGVQPQ